VTVCRRTDEKEEKTASGIILPETAKREAAGRDRMAAGPGRTDDDGKRILHGCQNWRCGVVRQVRRYRSLKIETRVAYSQRERHSSNRRDSKGDKHGKATRIYQLKAQQALKRASIFSPAQWQRH